MSAREGEAVLEHKRLRVTRWGKVGSTTIILLKSGQVNTRDGEGRVSCLEEAEATMLIAERRARRRERLPVGLVAPLFCTRLITRRGDHERGRALRPSNVRRTRRSDCSAQVSNGVL